MQVRLVCSILFAILDICLWSSHCRCTGSAVCYYRQENIGNICILKLCTCRLIINMMCAYMGVVWWADLLYASQAMESELAPITCQLYSGETDHKAQIARLNNTTWVLWWSAKFWNRFLLERFALRPPPSMVRRNTNSLILVPRTNSDMSVQ